MNERYLTDPDHPEASRQIEAELAEALRPDALPAGTPARLRLLERVRATADAEASLVRKPLAQGEWRPLVPGIRAKLLAPSQRAFLLDISPGASLPLHAHREDEECVVLRGEVRMQDVRVRAGDYHLAPATSRHAPVSAPDGALIYLRGTPIGHTTQAMRDIVAGVVPADEGLVTLRSGEDDWMPLVGGIHVRTLHERGGVQSCMLRFEPGTRLRTPPAAIERELLVVSGEVWFGRSAAHLGDHQLAPAGAACPEMASDEGAIVFVRGPKLA